ncbi:tripartite tricarboxylate transporter substrate binding protein [Pigmentiphaga sp.]|uniref:Bug family tripartite tricarboxylate transporter substrate binding protein n=1 Tax=Pigmentiphaga sp. TaxID=1977564 RepID=UPI00128BAF2F|nr:tripartite tricarboxylate transporter substrate binding protein [Pigmentiphaga sp.]MPS30300.1 tripartite tricarboxylate transporter substrate binding protein [Alcaligenaceae bacterium SAGV5]MPS52448.1 tripartite tricarboxylate transporter substrate binding protein [Alcaligenaceae bacterium SAGV3]MPT57512.1 tripartite tricarboxylate transporter substrate binding protein [Alcaligenaceae bacterium]
MYRALAAALVLGTLAVAPAHAGPYPDHPVRIINPFPPGTNTDTVARLLAQKLQQNWGQATIVENKTGAGGAIGASFVAKSPADGYTLLLTSSSTHLVAPVLRKDVPYDANKDFTPIMTVTVSPHVVVATRSLPVKDFKDFVAYVKAHPGTTFASSGNGTGYHLAGELFAHGVGANMLHIPYRGAAPAMNDLMGGQVQSMFDSPGSVAPNAKSGRVHALAVMGPKRWPTLPDVPTTVELGYPQLQFSTWLGLYAPANTPPDVIAKITNILTTELSKPGMSEQFDQMGSQLNMIVGKDFAKFMLDGQASLKKLAEEAKLPMLD